MAYISFTLKYRPRNFEDIVGQEHVSRTLRNALSNSRVAHAYLFAGPRGTGKTTTARVLARALNCVEGPTPSPCGVCDLCRAVDEGRAMDIIEIDAASNRGIDDIRELREKVKYSPAEARCKLYILDEVHMLTTEAFNALLKTLEEPPDHAFFTLLTTESHKIPPTILSRCQRFEFRPVSLPDMITALRRIVEGEGLVIDDDALAAIAQAADGAMRDAQSILDQVVAFSEGEITLDVVGTVLGVTAPQTLAEIAEVVADANVVGAFEAVDRLVTEGKDLGRLIEDLTRFFRDLLRLSLGSGAGTWLQLGPQGEQRMKSLAERMGPARLMEAVRTLAELRGKLKSSTQHSLLLELCLARLCCPVQEAAPSPQPAGAPAPRPAAAAKKPPVAAPVPQAPVAPQAPAAPQAAQQPRQPEAKPVEASEAAEQSVSPPAASPAPAVTGGPLSLQSVQNCWQHLPDYFRRKGHFAVWAILREGTPQQLDGERLTICFPPNRTFHRDKVQNDYNETVCGGLQELLGHNVSISCRLYEKDEAPAPAPQPPLADEPSPAPAFSEEPPPTEEPASLPPPPAPAPAPTEPIAEQVTPPPAAPEPQKEVEESGHGEDKGASEPQKTDTVIGNGDDNSDEIVAQTLNLFEGSEEITPEDEE